MEANNNNSYKCKVCSRTFVEEAAYNYHRHYHGENDDHYLPNYAVNQWRIQLYGLNRKHLPIMYEGRKYFLNPPKDDA